VRQRGEGLFPWESKDSSSSCSKKATAGEEVVRGAVCSQKTDVAKNQSLSRVNLPPIRSERKRGGGRFG